MANTQTQTFSVQIFRSGSLMQADPDVQEEVSSLAVQLAVQRVMDSHQIAFAAVVYVTTATVELWLHDVAIIHGQMSFSHPVERDRSERVECRFCGYQMHQTCCQCGKPACYRCGRKGGFVYCASCKSLVKRMVVSRRTRRVSV